MNEHVKLGIVGALWVVLFMITCTVEEPTEELSFKTTIENHILSPVTGATHDRSYIYGSDDMVDVYALSDKGVYMWFKDQKWYKVEGSNIIMDACGDGAPYEQWVFVIVSKHYVIINNQTFRIK